MQNLKCRHSFTTRIKKYNSFAEILIQTPGADKLHFLISASIVGYLQQLNCVVPDILNNLGKHFLKFTQYRFEIINSDLQNKASHQVAISFFSEPLVLYDTLDSNLLVSAPDTEKNEDGVMTEMLPLQPFLSIYLLKNIER